MHTAKLVARHLCIAVAIATVSSLHAANFSLGYSGQDRVEIAYSGEIEKAALDAKTDWTDEFGNADWRPSGDYLVPVQVIMVACPVGSIPVLHLANASHFSSASSLPVKALDLEPESAFPVAAISHVERWRGFQIAHVELRLADASGNNTSVLSTANLSITFTGNARPAAAYSREEKSLAGLVVNAAQATRWWELPPLSRSVLDNSAEAWPAYQLHKLSVTETGVYSVTADWLQLQGVPVLGAQSSRVKLFGNGGRLLAPGLLSVPDSALKENAILVEDGDDGTLDQGDRIVFYAEGLKGFDYCDGSVISDEGHASPFATENVFWLGIDPSGTPGLRMQSMTQPLGATPVETVKGRAYLDQEQFIYAVNAWQSNSGLVWFMATIDGHTERSFSMNLESATTGRGSMRIRMPSISGAGNDLTISVNNTPVSTGVYLQSLFIEVPAGTFSPGNNVIRFTNNSTRQILLNYIEIEYDRSPSSNSGAVEISAPSGVTGALSYQTGLSSSAYVFDVTNPLVPRMTRGSQFADSSFANAPRRYFAADPNRVRQPAYRGRKVFDAADYSLLRDPQNEAGLVIITYDDWYEDLQPLVDMHEEYKEEPLTTVRVKLSDVYDEFAWGVEDPTGIRNFLRYAHDYWRGPSGQSEPPQYVLFVGDGDYDYRNLISSSDDNWMPPWESVATCTDDYYVEFDDGAALLDMMSGRWPVQSSSELQAIMNKTIEYATRPLYGPWKNTATFVADDEWKEGGCSEDSLHTRDSELLIRNVLPDYFTFRKIYEIFYPFRQSTSTSAKPDGTRDLIETINNGTLLINYIGHGNERVWTDEQLFVMERDNPLIDNQRTWPVIVAGTCTWGGYDRPNERCFPELLLSGRNVGAIACIAATRFTFVTQNQSLTDEFYTRVFTQGIDSRSSLGSALRYAKPLRQENRLYHTLGDPVLRLATPEYFAHVDERDDSLQAGNLFHLTGFVSKTNDAEAINFPGPRRSTDDEVWADFQGVVEARVFDSEDSAAYYFPLPGNCSVLSSRPYYYGLPGNAIFRGRSTIANGRFEVTFRVPRDIQYGGNNAKVSLYFFGKSDSESDSADGIGIERPLRIASAAAAVIDTIPPAIGAWLENTSFRNGDQVSRSPVLIVDLSDESGLNLSGEVGHKITVRIDDAQAEDITQFFNYDVDSYTEGELSRTIGPLSEGPHRLTVEAWDSFNNLNTFAADFLVGQAAEEGYAIRDVLSWPNPMAGETYFTYSLTQDGTRDVRIRIFTMTGKLVAEMDDLGTRQLYNSNSNRPWNGRDREGHELANGVYFYRVIASHERGYTAEATGKLVILR